MVLNLIILIMEPNQVIGLEKVCSKMENINTFEQTSNLARGRFIVYMQIIGPLWTATSRVRYKMSLIGHNSGEDEKKFKLIIDITDIYDQRERKRKEPQILHSRTRKINGQNGNVTT